MKKVSKEKFDAIMKKKAIRLKGCKKCGYVSPEVVIMMPQYGRFGACVRCSHCGAETKLYGITYTMFDDERMGTPTIERSLMYGVKRAIQEWNGITESGTDEQRNTD